MSSRKSYELILTKFQSKLTISTSKADPNLPAIVPKLDLIEILGWDSEPSQVTFTYTGSSEPVVIDPSNYTYFTMTKKLQISYEMDMNINHIITFE